MSVRMWCVVIVLLVGCEHSPSKPPVRAAPSDAAPAAALPFEKTAALITRADLAAKVDALAAQPRIEASHVGIGGTASAIFASWDAVRAAATPDELVLLLRHESPIVRG